MSFLQIPLESFPSANTSTISFEVFRALLRFANNFLSFFLLSCCCVSSIFFNPVKVFCKMEWICVCDWSLKISNVLCIYWIGVILQVLHRKAFHHWSHICSSLFISLIPFGMLVSCETLMIEPMLGLDFILLLARPFRTMALMKELSKSNDPPVVSFVEKWKEHYTIREFKSKIWWNNTSPKPNSFVKMFVK